MPNLAAAVANEFLTSILSEDADTRTNNAAEKDYFLEREVKRLQGEHDAVAGQIEAAYQRPPDKLQAQSDEAAAQMKDLAQAEAEVAQVPRYFLTDTLYKESLRKKSPIRSTTSPVLRGRPPIIRLMSIYSL